MVLRVLTGRRFGRLVVAERSKDSRGGKARWACRCDCGRQVVVHGSALTTGNTQSCGCLWRESISTHGRARTREYRAWRAAKRRCYRPTYSGYPDYGGRGIRMAAEWANDFAAFFAAVGPCPDGLSLDRLDVNGHYEPGNVRWASPVDQANNRRRHRLVSIGGVTMTVAEAARAMGIDWKTARRRYEHA